MGLPDKDKIEEGAGGPLPPTAAPIEPQFSHESRKLALEFAVKNVTGSSLEGRACEQVRMARIYEHYLSTGEILPLEEGED